jgi:hypothetical protein
MSVRLNVVGWTWCYIFGTTLIFWTWMYIQVVSAEVANDLTVTPRFLLYIYIIQILGDPSMSAIFRLHRMTPQDRFRWESDQWPHCQRGKTNANIGIHKSFISVWYHKKCRTALLYSGSRLVPASLAVHSGSGLTDSRKIRHSGTDMGTVKDTDMDMGMGMDIGIWAWSWTWTRKWTLKKNKKFIV